MRYSVKVKLVKDDKVWKKMVRNLSKVGSQNAVEVGWWNNTHPTGVPVARVAFWNEEGHMTTWGAYSPPRPFISLGFMGDVKKSKLSKYVHMVALIAEGKMSWQTMNKLLAEELVNTMKKNILDWKLPANRESTIAIKGHDDVLIHTGTMYDRVKSRIVRK